MADYPQHERLSEIKDTSQEIGFFLETMRGQGWNFMRWGRAPVAEFPCDYAACVDGRWKDDPDRWHVRCKGTGYVTLMADDWIADNRTIEQVLSDYFGIDYRELQAEKDRMLFEFRRANADG